MITIRQIDASKNKAFDDHECVFAFSDTKASLRGLIAWHNTKLGPATGGTRLFDYKNQKDALTDVLRLSRAMSYKCALADVSFGGGKAVIIGKKFTEPMMRSYAKIIDAFAGLYTTGTDVGVTDKNVLRMAKLTPYILKGNLGGKTTSFVAALGVYHAFLASVHFVFPKRSAEKITVAIKGLGKIGGELVAMLSRDGYTIIVADPDVKKIRALKKKFPKITSVDTEKIFALPADVYMPCALGNEFTKNNISKLACKIIVGGANNQLEEQALAVLLQKRGIVYIPDYVANAGGLIQIVDELGKNGYTTKRVEQKIRTIGTTVSRLLRNSKKKGVTPLALADALARKKIFGTH